MKTIVIKPTLLLLLFAFILLGCSSTNNLTMNVTEPAPVYVPNHIQRIGILNRSESTSNKTLDDIDKIFSAEGLHLDREGADNIIQGMQDEFEKNKTFKDVILVESDKVENPGLGIFPNALSWNMVNQICEENNIDALVVLSFYDTDASIKYNAQTIDKVNAFGIKIPVIEHTAEVNTNILAGFRIYDNANKTILDEIMNSDWSRTIGRGINPVKAAEAIAGRTEAVLQISNGLGHRYALRTYPFKIRVTREYYVKGTDNFEIAMRRAQTGDWDGAAELWELEISNPNSKIAGRACYNMAIINEINGDLLAAKDWASKAYTDYRDKNALRYLNILKNRMAKNELLAMRSN
ncbi:DUF6340 family protein [Yeosuana sp. MJ-SS3]|uniref:DUF6340 family protein n=1 Tax=Gilvirhabdus luticola TaxID=3079858 RepID=A0ABU3U644_9FLAO|nr:DUF6340 family protein [Yeosuana sp. MJ-SS3]MDU8885865.1 DUF6340 family protein [Yeosuana sp. MJ-SS3]